MWRKQLMSLLSQNWSLFAYHLFQIGNNHLHVSAGKAGLIQKSWRDAKTNDNLFQEKLKLIRNGTENIRSITMREQRDIMKIDAKKLTKKKKELEINKC